MTIKPLSDAETDARRVRLARIADRHLDQLAKLPVKDRLTVASTILGSVMMEIDPSQQVEMLDRLMGGILQSIQTGGIG